MRLPQQVPRLAIVFAVAIVALVVARALLVPATFGDYGHYRAAAVDSIAVRAVRFAGRQECEECHDDIAAERVEGHHRTLSCEVCHGPQRPHVEDPINVTPEPADAGRPRRSGRLDGPDGWSEASTIARGGSRRQSSSSRSTIAVVV